MKLLHARSVKSFTSQDGRQRLHLFARDDGLYEFRSEELVHEPLDFRPDYTIWEPRAESGLYDSLEHAERDARSTFSWLASATVET